MIENAGTVSGSTIDGDGIELSSPVGNNSLINSGSITGDLGVFLNGDGAGFESIANSGVLKGWATGLAILSTSATVVNSGTILAGELAGGAAITLTGNSTFSAAPKVSAAKSTARGVTSSVTDDAIHNTGTIESEVAIEASGVAVQISNAGEIEGALQAGANTRVSLDNSGTWTTNAQSPELQFGSNDDKIVNSGKIEAPISIASGGDSFSNAGTIAGSIDFTGSGNDDALRNAGSIVGNVTMGHGAELLANSAHGAIDGGILFLGAGSRFQNGGDVDGDVSLISGSSVVINSGAINGGLGFNGKTGDDQVSNSGAISGGVNVGDATGDQVHNGVKGTIRANVLGNAVTFSGLDDALTNSGVLDGGVDDTARGDTIANAGLITGSILLIGAITNQGVIDGGIDGAGAIVNYGTIGGSVDFSAKGGSLADWGTIDGGVTLFASDALTLEPGRVLGDVACAASDTLTFLGAFGRETITGFTDGSASGHDTIDFSANDFSSFAGIQGAMTQQGRRRGHQARRPRRVDADEHSGEQSDVPVYFNILS